MDALSQTTFLEEKAIKLQGKPVTLTSKQVSSGIRSILKAIPKSLSCNGLVGGWKPVRNSIFYLVCSVSLYLLGKTLSTGLTKNSSKALTIQ